MWAWAANCAAVSAETSSAAGGVIPVVGPAAAALSLLTVEPMVCRSRAAALSASGCVVTNDMWLSFPNRFLIVDSDTGLQIALRPAGTRQNVADHRLFTLLITDAADRLSASRCMVISTTAWRSRLSSSRSLDAVRMPPASSDRYRASASRSAVLVISEIALEPECGSDAPPLVALAMLATSGIPPRPAAGIPTAASDKPAAPILDTDAVATRIV